MKFSLNSIRGFIVLFAVCLWRSGLLKNASMMYYLKSQYPDLVLLLRERKSSSLRHMFEDVVEVKENIRASKWVHRQVYLENLQVHEQEDCQFVSNS